MIRKFLFFVAMAFSMLASANDYTFVEGVNTIQAYVAADATFTPDRDGKVLVECREASWAVEYNGKKYDHRYVPGSGYAYVYEIPSVAANTTISMSNGFPMNSSVKITVYADGAVPVNVLAVTPKTGGVFSWNNTGMVSINFNKNVTISGIKLIAGDYTSDVDDVHLGSSMGFNVTNALNAALKDGKLNVGDKFQVKITGLRDVEDKENLYNGTGELVLEYIAPHPQHNFVSAVVGENQLSYIQANTYKFLSYYSPEAEDGLFVFDFDGEIGKVGGVVLTMGNLDLDTQGKYHRSNLPYTISGNKLLVDARGVLRTIPVLFPAIVEEEADGEEQGNDMLGTFDTEHITITLHNVLDVNGNAFRCMAQGSVGSYSFVMNYEEIIDEVYIDGDNKQDGDEVRSGEEVSLWVSNADIKFGGIHVSYFVEADTNDENDMQILDQRIVVVDNYTMVPDPVEGFVVTFNMPEMKDVVEGSTVRVALIDAKSADGMPHYLYIEFKAVAVANAILSANLSGKKDSKLYRLDGTQVKGNAMSGIYLREGKKVVLK